MGIIKSKEVNGYPQKGSGKWVSSKGKEVNEWVSSKGKEVNVIIKRK
jgi:hypothetical protein